jgi:transcriptional regulator with XRE-family HTH domain
MKYGSNIRLIRVLRGKESKEIYMQLKMSQGNYDKIERDEIGVSEENLAFIAKELRVTPEFIKSFQKGQSLFGSSNQQAENAHYVIHPSSEKALALLEAALHSMQEEIAFLREQNKALLQKLK